MKALIISNFDTRFLPGHYSMIDPLMSLGYEVTWASNFSQFKGDLAEAPCRTVHIDFLRNPFHPKNYRAFKQLAALLRQEQYHIVHCNTPIGGVLGRICAYMWKVPLVVYTAHGFHFYNGAPLVNRTVFRWIEAFLARITDVLITINREDYQAAQSFKLHKQGPIYHIPGIGVDTSIVRSAKSKRETLLQQLGLAEPTTLMVSVGELNQNKNNSVVIKALAMLADRNVHYLVCGTGELKEELNSLAHQYGLERNIHFLGYRSDIPGLLKASDIFIQSSYREGLSRSVMEAMSAGLPCIISKIRGNVDLIADGKGGFLCLPDDVDSFAQAIRTLTHDMELKKKMGQSNLLSVEKFDVTKVKKEMLYIYSNALARNGHVPRLTSQTAYTVPKVNR